MAQLTPNIIVKDVNATVNYYRENLNFTLSMGVDSEKQTCLDSSEDHKLIWAMINLNGADLMIQHVDSISEELPEFQMSSDGKCLTLYFKIDLVLEFYEQIKEKVEVVKEPYKTFYGSNEFVIRDQNGFFLYFAEMPNE